MPTRRSQLSPSAAALEMSTREVALLQLAKVPAVLARGMKPLLWVPRPLLLRFKLPAASSLTLRALLSITRLATQQ
jgi:hypothetical protein